MNVDENQTKEYFNYQEKSYVDLIKPFDNCGVETWVGFPFTNNLMEQ